MIDPTRCPMCGAPKATKVRRQKSTRGGVRNLNHQAIIETCGHERCVLGARRVRLQNRALPLALAMAPRWIPLLNGRPTTHDGRVARVLQEGLQQWQLTTAHELRLSKTWRDPRKCPAARRTANPTPAAGLVPGRGIGVMIVRRGVQPSGGLSDRGRAVRDALGSTYTEQQGRDLVMALIAPQTLGDRTEGAVELLCDHARPVVMNLLGSAGSARVLADPGAKHIEEVLREHA